MKHESIPYRRLYERAVAMCEHFVPFSTASVLKSLVEPTPPSRNMDVQHAEY
jgi:hypothetical protein